MTTDDRLTAADVRALNEILVMAETTAKVRWVNPDGDLRDGIARNLTYKNADYDIRNAELRITTRTGLEMWLPVAHILPLVKTHEFAAYDWSN